MEREITWRPAYDKRDPDPSKNYGIHGVEMRWLVTGSEGVIQFVVYTSWHLPYVQTELDSHLDRQFPHLSCHPSGADLGYHSRVPRYEGQTVMQEHCTFIDAPCYYDGSTMAAEAVLTLLITDGGEAVWARLEEEYAHRLGSSDA